MRKLLADGMSYADPTDVMDEQAASVVNFYFIDMLIYPLYANFIGNFSHFIGDQEFEEERELSFFFKFLVTYKVREVAYKICVQRVD